jgi:hypothetical protein
MNNNRMTKAVSKVRIMTTLLSDTLAGSHEGKQETHRSHADDEQCR